MEESNSNAMWQPLELDTLCLTNESLVLIAKELFLELDAREAAEVNPQSAI